MYLHINKRKGLQEEEVMNLKKRYGKNKFTLETKGHFIHLVWNIVKEPMFLLLMGACLLYFLLGESREGFMMIAAMCFVGAISVYQEFRSARALAALRQLTEPTVQVIRNDRQIRIASEDLLPGDVMILSEGEKIPADAKIIQSNDFTVNEGIITGESFPVARKKDSLLYQGSIVNTGHCKAVVTAIGNDTYLGKLGKSITHITDTRTLLQHRIGRLVRSLAFFGLGAFLLIFTFNYLQSSQLIGSLLFGLTLAMAAIPEEIPVAFSSFMALGAYHMSRRGIITRQPQTVESLGAVTTICLDKTGTITENKMSVKFIYDFNTRRLIDMDEYAEGVTGILYYGVLASEREPFDEMEKAIWKCYREYKGDGETPRMIHEYPLEGQPPMMTHVFHENHYKIAAAKGGAERILEVCKLNEDDYFRMEEQVHQLASRGYRVIGVAGAVHTDESFPVRQDDFHWQFKGLLALYDPPRAEVGQVLSVFYDAGIQVKLLTGDYPETARQIASQVGMREIEKLYTGTEVMKLSGLELSKAVRDSNLFARMFPEAKLRVIDMLKANHEVVAMIGDGVNDGPAIKAAHIGIAMGKKGTELARQAADLIITDDHLGKIEEAIEHGRKIYNNLKKAIRYIISIHIPIILTASLPLILGWTYPNIFTPIHVIFLELIMGPTCSIFYEREPAEPFIMKLPPRNRAEGLFTASELLTSIVQGLMIAAGLLILYYVYAGNSSLEKTRTIVFTTLLCGNIFLTFANRSFTESMIKTRRYQNNLVLPVLLLSIVFLLCLLLIPAVQQIFGLVAIPVSDFFICLVTALVSVGWFEVYKLV